MTGIAAWKTINLTKVGYEHPYDEDKFFWKGDEYVNPYYVRRGYDTQGRLVTEEDLQTGEVRFFPPS